MNKNILLLSLMAISYAPEANFNTGSLTSTYIFTSFIVRDVKNYLNDISDLTRFEKATHNAPKNPLSARSAALQFVDDFIKYHQRVICTNMIQPNIQIEMEGSNAFLQEEFDFNSDYELMYNELVEALKLKRAELTSCLFLGHLSDTRLNSFYDLQPIMPFAIFEAMESGNDILLKNNEFLVAITELAIKTIKSEEDRIKDLVSKHTLENDESISEMIKKEEAKIKEKAMRVACKALERRSEEVLAHDQLKIAETALELGNTDLVNQILAKILNEYERYPNLNEIIEMAFKVGNIDIANQFLEKTLADDNIQHHEAKIAELAHKIGNDELANRAFDEALKVNNEAREDDEIAKIAPIIKDTRTANEILEQLLREYDHEAYNGEMIPHVEIARSAHKIGNVELANRALTQACIYILNTIQYLEIAKVAHELGNIDLANEALEKAFNPESMYMFGDEDNRYYDLAKAAHKIGNKEMENKALTSALELYEDIGYYNSIKKLAEELGNKEIAKKASWRIAMHLEDMYD